MLCAGGWIGIYWLSERLQSYLIAKGVNKVAMPLGATDFWRLVQELFGKPMN